MHSYAQQPLDHYYAKDARANDAMFKQRDNREKYCQTRAGRLAESRNIASPASRPYVSSCAKVSFFLIFERKVILEDIVRFSARGFVH